MGKLDKLPGVDESNTRRRNVVVGGVYALAGCIGLGAVGGDGGDDGDDNDTGSTNSETSDTEADTGGSVETETPEPTEEPTETETPEPTEEDDGTDIEERTHDVGESFTVGDGNRVIEYTVNTIEDVEALAPNNEIVIEEPDGIFIVVELEIENKTDESFDISTGNFAIETENDNTFDPSTDVVVAFDTDERFDTESILFEQINPNLPTEGAVIFDIPPDVSFSLRIEPVGFLSTAEPHFVNPS